MTLTDWRGNEIAVGDLVVYPAQSGSSAAHMVEGRVVEIFEAQEYKGWGDMITKMKVAPSRRSGWGVNTAWDGKPVVLLTSMRHVMKVTP